MNKMKNKTRGILIITGIVLITVLFPFFLNWIIQKDAFSPIVGDRAMWLSFWPVYLSAIASFGMIYFTYRSLQQNKKQLEEMRLQREEEERARLVFSVIVYEHAFMLKISNIGKRNVYDATIMFNEEFLNDLLEDRFQEGYRQLSKSFFVEARTSRYLYIGWCQDINDAWKNKHVVIKMKGSYNGVYTIDEELNMNMFLDKTFIVVQGDLETTAGHIKKGLIVQNNSYMPVQKSLDYIAKSIKNVETSLKNIAERLDNSSDESVGTEVKEAGDSQESITNEDNTDTCGQEIETGD